MEDSITTIPSFTEKRWNGVNNKDDKYKHKVKE